MMWLRERPKTLEELDRVDWRGRWIGEDDDEADTRAGGNGEKGDLFEGVAGGQDEEAEGDESEEEEEEEEPGEFMSRPPRSEEDR